MASHHWQSLGARFGAGHGAWALVAFLFPTLAIVKDDMLFSGASQGFFWIFFALRLLSDLGGLRPGERERIRARIFDKPASESTSDLSARSSAPPPFSRSHARLEADDPRRLPR